MLDELDDRSRPSSLPNLIASVSLCLLSAAWGPALAPNCRTGWACIGLFGLAAAVGLGALERSRLSRTQEEERRTWQLRLDQDLAKFVSPIKDDDFR